MHSYAGKKAVVVGGTHGMGRAVVERLVAGGAEVLLTGNNEGTVEAARREVGARVVRSDVTSVAANKELAAVVGEKLGRVDLVHYNAGFAMSDPFEQVTEESYDRTFAVNTRGAFFTVQHLAPLVNDGGAIVFTSSIADVGGISAMVTYAGAKAAVMALARGIAAALLPRRIRVNVVAPGFVDTPSMGVPGITDEQRAAFMRQGDEITPMQRHGTVDEVAAAVLFLAFEATFTTGERFTVDGGLGQHINR
ncbi:SDR family oxidoreductase [Actinokineospora terrae]|uniref:Ketoreductase domain-containing protein n=1 Tax=Actinokineospora terrae TaxID=155974 RepID=A0A1H9KSX1_9PSEU|nr:SDR family oxidoreductase [Actinokineospora terrae]SER02222.1 hypothetical protein SAMN04487818_101310 [Actinokineospora terrae]